MTSSPSRLRGENLTIGYDDRVIISDLDIAIPDQEITTIIGPNGAGKTTLLRLLEGVQEPTEGRVVRGKTVQVATLSQSTHELDALTDLRVVEAVSMVGEHVTVGGKELTAAQLVERLGFTRQRAWTRVGEVSGGERRRLVVGVVRVVVAVVGDRVGGQRADQLRGVRLAGAVEGDQLRQRRIALQRKSFGVDQMRIGAGAAAHGLGGVVDQDVHVADEGRAGLGGFVVGVVEPYVGDALDRVAYGIRIAGGAVDPVSPRDELAGDLGPDATGRAGHENGLLSHVLPAGFEPATPALGEPCSIP